MGWIYRNLILPSVLFLIAWNLAPFFTTLVSFIPVEAAFAWLGQQIEILVTGTDGQLRPPEFYIEVIVWTVVLWVLVQGITLPFGALVGATENFSERKLYRHTQFFGL